MFKNCDYDLRTTHSFAFLFDKLVIKHLINVSFDTINNAIYLHIFCKEKAMSYLNRVKL